MLVSLRIANQISVVTQPEPLSRINAWVKLVIIICNVYPNIATRANAPHIHRLAQQATLNLFA
jgi:hypothetical protein